jgi:hypothetical protein
VKRQSVALALGLTFVALGYTMLEGADSPELPPVASQRADEPASAAVTHAPEAEAPHPVGLTAGFPGQRDALDQRSQLQKRAHLVDVAREVLSARDLTAAEILLSYSQANGALLTPPDAQALELAVECLREADEEVQDAAATFLREVHASVLRKHVRRVCFAETR